MRIVTTLPLRIHFQAWLAKVPFLALILTIAAFGPLLSFDHTQHQQQSTLASHSLQSLKAGGLSGKPFGAMFTAAGVIMSIGGALAAVAVILADAKVAVSAAIGFGMFFGGLAVLVVGVGAWVYGRQLWNEAKTDPEY